MKETEVTLRRTERSMKKAAEERNSRLKGGLLWRALDTAIFFFFVLTVIMSVRFFLIEPRGVKGGSMLDTFQDGDYVFVEKLTYAFSDPKKGDIVICYYPDAYYEAFHVDYATRIKRVMATAGDRVQSINGKLYVNYEPVDEPYLTEHRSQTTGITEPYIVPEGCVYVLGDNRINSTDSRSAVVGAIPISDIVGKVRLELYPDPHIP